MASDTLFGVHMLFNGGPSRLGDGNSADSLKKYIDEAAKLGTDIIRFPGDWNALEPDKGQWNQDYIDSTREAIRYADQLGIKVVMLFAQTPQWARPNPNDSVWHPPANNGDFANAIAYFYDQLLDVDGAIAAWEVWNEPNVFEFWGSADPATDTRQVDGQAAFVLIDTRFAQNYTAMLNTAYDALHNAARAANNNITVLGGSVNTDYQYVQAMLDADAKFDGLSVHPYTRPNDSPGADYGTPWAPDATAAQFDNSARPELNRLWSFEYGMNRLREMVDQDLWITEFGWAVGDEFGDVSAAEQSQYMETAMQLIQGWDDVRSAIAYRLFDDGDILFGLLNSDGSVRSSGEILKRYADIIDNGGSGSLQGTPGNDTLTGTPGNDELVGLAGDDVLQGLGGDDFYVGGAGSDRFVYSSGQDFIGDFDLAVDQISFSNISFSSFTEVQQRLQQWGPNAAIVISDSQWIVLENVSINQLSEANFGFGNTPSTPAVQGQRATVYVNDNNIVVGSAFQTGQAYNGALYTNTDAEFGTGASARDVILGTAGADNIWAGIEGNDLIDAKGGNDIVGMSLGNVTVFAGAGDDFVYGLGSGGGNNTVNLGAGKDNFWARSGNNTISGTGDNVIGLGLGTDTLRLSGNGSNIVYTVQSNGAGTGRKDIITGAGEDFVQLGAGDDLIDAGGGLNTLFGGDGADTFVFRRGAFNFIGDFERGQDSIRLNNISFGSLSFFQGAGASAADAFIFAGSEAIGQVANITVANLNNQANFS